MKFLSDSWEIIQGLISPHLSFLSAEPYPKYFILWGSGLCLLIAVAGGGIIKIKGTQIGNLKPTSRLISGALALVFLLIFFLVPSFHLSINGIFSDCTFESKINDEYEILLTKKNLVKKTSVGDEGFFSFPKSDKITEGGYYITIIKNGKSIVYNKDDYIVKRGKQHLLVIKQDVGYKVSDKSPFEYFRDQYKFEGDKWMLKFRALRHLIKMSKEDEQIRELVVAMMKSSDNREHNLAVFILGALSEESALDKLMIILYDKEKRYNIYEKMRAASQLAKYSGTPSNDSRTYKVISREFLFKNLMEDKVMVFGQDKTATIKRIAAWHLAEQAVINQCVIESLLSGVESCNVEISNEFKKLLGAIANIHNSFTKEQWQEWWQENKTNYDPCAQ